MKVNHAKLLPLQPCALKDGDYVQLGVPQDPGDPAYTWTFHTRLPVVMIIIGEGGNVRTVKVKRAVARELCTPGL